MAGKKGAGGKAGRSGRKAGKAYGQNRSTGRRRSGVNIRVPAWPDGWHPDTLVVAHATLNVVFCPHCGSYWFDGSPSISWYDRNAGEDDELFLGMASVPAGEEWHEPTCRVLSKVKSSINPA